MKALLSIIILLSACEVAFSDVYVDGYYRSNGTYVQPHYRTNPNRDVTDNYSYQRRQESSRDTWQRPLFDRQSSDYDVLGQNKRHKTSLEPVWR